MNNFQELTKGSRTSHVDKFTNPILKSPHFSLVALQPLAKNGKSKKHRPSRFHNYERLSRRSFNEAGSFSKDGLPHIKEPALSEVEWGETTANRIANGYHKTTRSQLTELTTHDPRLTTHDSRLKNYISHSEDFFINLFCVNSPITAGTNNITGKNQVHSNTRS